MKYPNCVKDCKFEVVPELDQYEEIWHKKIFLLSLNKLQNKVFGLFVSICT